MAKAKPEDSNLIVSIHGLDIRKGCLYKIENKLDKTAPDGFQKENTTKLPSQGISNSVSCRYIETGQGVGQYDTGFYVQSPCYAGLTPDQKKKIVADLQKHIVDPVEELKGVNQLDVTNTDFWDAYTVWLEEGRVFNTDKPLDLLDLYIAVNGFELCPAGQEGSPKFTNADYVVRDSAKSVSVSQGRAIQKSDATFLFGSYIRTDKDFLLNLLRNLGIIRNAQKPSDGDMKAAFSLWLEKDFQNAEYFNAAVDKFSTKEGQEELQITVNFKKWVEAGKIRKDGTEYVYKSVPLGPDLKSSLKLLLENPELEEIRDEIRIG